MTVRQCYGRRRDECAGSHLVGMLRKRGIDTMKDYLRKRGLDVKQARRMVQDRRVCEEEYLGFTPGDEPLTLTR